MKIHQIGQMYTDGIMKLKKQPVTWFNFQAHVEIHKLEYRL